MTSKSLQSPALRTLLGAALGFFAHVICLTLVAGVAMGSRMIDLGGPEAAAAEGIFWSVVLALLSSPSGIVVGGITAALSGPGSSWVRIMVGASIPSALSGLIVWGTFAFVLEQPNFRLAALITITGLVVASLVAAITRRFAASSS